MRNKAVQMSLFDIYNGVIDSIEEKKPELITLLEEHIDFDRLIPCEFTSAFYGRMGRKHIYHLESILRALILQKLLGLTTDVQLIAVLKCSKELREFCGFSKVPDASRLTRFKQDYCEFLVKVFERLVDMTEPICREISEKKADYLIYDTTGIEANVSENNPKFLNSKLKEAKKLSKGNPDFNPYKGVYSLLPDSERANPDVRQQYINWHYCYALKAGIVTNGLGIIRHISCFDDAFKKAHPQIVSSKTSDAHFNSCGTPICPIDGAPFRFIGKSGGKNRSVRFKWVCPKSVQQGTTRICTCEHPCTDSYYSKCVYTYPDKDLRLYPGIPRDTEHWDNLYRTRVTAHRTINLLKDTFQTAHRKTFNTLSLKADIFLSGIVQLVGVLLADALHKPDLIKSVRKMIA